MEPESVAERRRSAWGLLAVGGLLVVIALFGDLVGPDPDSGLLDLGPTATSWLLGLFGAAMALAGLRGLR